MTEIDLKKRNLKEMLDYIIDYYYFIIYIYQIKMTGKIPKTIFNIY